MQQDIPQPIESGTIGSRPMLVSLCLVENVIEDDRPLLFPFNNCFRYRSHVCMQTGANPAKALRGNIVGLGISNVAC